MDIEDLQLHRDGNVLGQHAPEKRQLARELRRNMPPAEEHLWQRLRRNQLNGLHFRRRQVIDGFIADFYCHTLGLVVEVDGDVHSAQAEYDAERSRIMGLRGLCVLRFSNAQVLQDTEAMLAAIARVAATR